MCNREKLKPTGCSERYLSNLSFHSKGFFMLLAFGWGYGNDSGYNKTVDQSFYMLSCHMCLGQWNILASFAT